MTQVPDFPLGVSWYQGDLETNANGSGSQTYVGRFSIETFAVAPGVDSTPVVHPGADDAINPPFDPIHTFHLGCGSILLRMRSQQDARVLAIR